MYTRHTNKTALQSQEMITEALFRLMAEKPFHAIRITEICEAAGVGRKTFYRHFELKEDIIAFRLDRLCAAYAKDYLGESLDEQLTYHFEFIRQHADEMIVLYNQGMSDMLNASLSILMPKTMPVWSSNPIEQEYISAYIMAGITAIAQVWVTGGFRESLDDIRQIVKQAQGGLIPKQPETMP